MGSENSKTTNMKPMYNYANPNMEEISRRLSNDKEIRVKKIYHVSKPQTPPPPPPPEPIPVPVMVIQKPVQRVVQIAHSPPPPPQQILVQSNPSVNLLRKQVLFTPTKQVPIQTIVTNSPRQNFVRINRMN